jgi:hypothetical protein
VAINKTRRYWYRSPEGEVPVDAVAGQTGKVIRVLGGRSPAGYIVQLHGSGQLLKLRPRELAVVASVAPEPMAASSPALASPAPKPPPIDITLDAALCRSVLKHLESHGFGLVWQRMSVSVTPAPGTLPVLVSVRLVGETPVLEIPVPTALNPKKATRSTRQDEYGSRLALVRTAERALADQSLELPVRVALIVQALVRTQHTIIGGDGLHAAQLLGEARGRPASAGLPGLGRHR